MAITGMVIASAFAAAPQASAGVVVLSGALTADQIVDGGGSTSTATGFATLSLNVGAATSTLAADSLTLDFSWVGLTGPADRSHLHDAPAGVSRLVTDPFDAFFDEVFYSNNPLRTIDCSAWSPFALCVPASGSLHFVQSFSDLVDTNPNCDPSAEVCSVQRLVDLALTSQMYLDMHTQAYPSGEIRGQLLPVPEPSSALLIVLGLALLGLSKGNRGSRAPGRRPG